MSALPERPYALLVYGSIESFGEVVILLEFAARIRRRYRCVFLSLDAPSPRAAIIANAGHQSLFYFGDDGRIDRALQAALLARPPEFCIASDYSQFNVYRHNLATIRAGERLMLQLAEQHGTRSAVTDLLGLSFECSMRLRRPYSAIVIPESGYRKPLHAVAADYPATRMFSLARRGSRKRFAAEGRFDPQRLTVFVSYPQPHSTQLGPGGYSIDRSCTPFAALWVRCIERALAYLRPAANVVAFAELQPLFASRTRLTALPDDAPVEAVDQWLGVADVVITPNYISTLAARAAQRGAHVLVAYNDLACDRHRVPHELAERRARARRKWGALWRAVECPEFDHWLPEVIFSAWPGVDATLTGMVQNATGVPLFQQSVIAGAIRRKQPLRRARGRFPVVPCLAIAGELAGG